MCHGDDARPPEPPVSGPLGSHGDLTLTSVDGTEFMAYAALPAQPGNTGVVILPDVRGLHQYYKDLTDAFARAGFSTVAIDYFGRTAETDARDESFAYRPHVEQTTPEAVDADVAAAIAYPRLPPEERQRASSPSASVSAAARRGGKLRSRMASPGRLGSMDSQDVPAPTSGQMHAPLLLLVAGADFTPLEEFQAFDQELTDAGVPHEMVVYPGAPHSFFDRTFAEHNEICADAWRQMLAFFASPLA